MYRERPADIVMKHAAGQTVSYRNDRVFRLPRYEDLGRRERSGYRTILPADVGEEAFARWRAQTAARAEAEGWHLDCFSLAGEMTATVEEQRLWAFRLLPDAPEAWRTWRGVRPRRHARLLAKLPADAWAELPTLDEFRPPPTLPSEEWPRGRAGPSAELRSPGLPHALWEALESEWLARTAAAARERGFRLRYRHDAINSEHGYSDVWLEPQVDPRA